MILHRSSIRLQQHCLQCLRHTRVTRGRRHASSASAPNISTTPQPNAALTTLTNELDRIAPRFEIAGDDIEILHAPADFYDVLKVRNCPRLQHLLI